MHDKTSSRFERSAMGRTKFLSCGTSMGQGSMRLRWLFSQGRPACAFFRAAVCAVTAPPD
jgi:hypothetical protein